ncbi:MAG TPA: hypothetical protein VI653_00875 [Steroidobacteraceae bacterium]
MSGDGLPFSSVPSYHDARFEAQGQKIAFVLQQDERLAYRLARDCTVRRTAYHLMLTRQGARRRSTLFKQARPQLHSQDASHDIIDTGFGNVTGTHLRDGVVRAARRCGFRSAGPLIPPIARMARH